MSRPRIAAPFVFVLAALVFAQSPRGSFRFGPEIVARSFQVFAGSVDVCWDDEYFYVESSGMPRHRLMVGIRSWNR